MRLDINQKATPENVLEVLKQKRDALNLEIKELEEKMAKKDTKKTTKKTTTKK